MNFGTDTSQIKELASKLKTNASEIEKVLENIFNKLEGLNGNGWEGETYESFFNQCKAYKPALDKIPEVINDFANFFNGTVNQNATTLHDNVKTEFSNIENV